MRIIAIIVVSSLFGGCSSSPTKYPNQLDKNVTINLKIDDEGGLFSSVKVVAGVNNLDKQCEPHYKGMLKLEQGENQLGLAPGIQTFLQVDVAHKRPGQSSIDSRGTLITPVKGKKYRIDINYVDDMYDFRLFELSGSKKKSMTLVPISNCRKG